MSAAPALAVPGNGWAFPAGTGRYDRRPELAAGELAVLRELGVAGLRRGWGRGWDRSQAAALARLAGPLDEARAALRQPGTIRHRRASADAAALVLLRCAEAGSSYWGWSSADWLDLLGTDVAGFLTAVPWPADPAIRPVAIALAYVLGGFNDIQELGTFNRCHLAGLVFGAGPVGDAITRVSAELTAMGYRAQGRGDQRLPGSFSQILLINRSPLLADLTTGAFAALRAHPAMAAPTHSRTLFATQRAAAAMGYCAPPIRAGYDGVAVIEGASRDWAAWVERWYATSPLTPKSRAVVRCNLAKAGRWLAAEYPEISAPGQWTRQTCAAWVAAVDRMSVGDYVQRRDAVGARAGAPILPRTKAHILAATRTFFRDCQEWEWTARRFDPARALGIPRSIKALIGPSPRVIADDAWAKLLHAGLNLAEDDLPGGATWMYYPIEMIRAITLTWLFAGLRSDEITRLRVGCVRWQHDGVPVPGDSADVLASDAVCLLDVPVSKTCTAFTKPVDPLLGQAIEAWQAIRPGQPGTADRKTGERPDMLFATRAQPVARAYINRTIIPALCRKAGVPASDVRGNITSHRARSTIASQLYNAKEPMTLFELQAWLGHKTPATTQHYAKITPNTLSKAYTEAGYFARNVRTIEILLDRDAVTSGDAAAGQPWQHYDLGHGYCAYTFFEQCPHRMACARCDFYTPKNSARAQLLEARDNLQRMLVTIPLTDDERAAVDDGQAAVASLIERLADTPTPAGATPRQLGVPPSATQLPITAIR